jgi:hypothetical protein
MTKNKISRPERKFCIKDKNKNIRYILCESKFEALERIRSQDCYIYPIDFYKITKKKI